MKRFVLVFLSSLFVWTLLAQKRTNGRFSASGEYMETKASVGLGLENIYVFKTLEGATITYETEPTNTVKIYTYQTAITDKTPVDSTNIQKPRPGVYIVSKLEDGKGLIMEDANQSKSVWITNYSQHKPVLTSITPAPAEDECDALKLVVDKSDLLEYRGTGGQARQIGRKYDISYDVLEWSDAEKDFVKKRQTITELDIGTEFILDNPIPNLDTKFKISGDQFGNKFKIPTEKESDIYEAISIEAHIEAIQEQRDNDNEQNDDGGNLGGSAPVSIKFFGHANEPVANFYTWYIYDNKDLKNSIARYSDKDMDYNFEVAGNYTVMFEVANATSTCVDTASVTFTISESFLKIPNFFTPGSSFGSNDEFKVAYRSIIKFRCTIFNRWGNKVYEWSDPAQGWDGRYKGNLVKPGVYYYVIEATGSDGIRYKKGGDINILR